MPHLSETATSILVLLNNINDLIMKSNDRTSAKEEMKALSIFGEEKGFPLPQDKIDNFQLRLLDSKPFTLNSMILDIAEDVIFVDQRY